MQSLYNLFLKPLSNQMFNQNPNRFVFLLLASFGVAALTGCASTSVLDPSEERHLDAGYDFSDKQKIVDKLTESLLAARQATGSATKPILIVYPVTNETSEHISTSGISDDIRLKLIQSGAYRFINEAQRGNIQKETAYQTAGHVDPAMQLTKGKQLGADYILSGTLRSIAKKEQRQIRLTKTKLIYYSLNLEMTDLNTGEITWADNVEIARESSRPIIGW